MDNPEILYQFLFSTELAAKCATEAYVYTIIDGAVDEQYYEQLLKLGPSYRSLFSGQLADDLETANPWLVLLKPDHAFTHWFVKHIYSKKAACMFRTNESSLDDLAEHFSVYSSIQLEQEEINDPTEGLLAFYDPEVFPLFRSILEKDQARNFFMPVGVWYHETIDRSDTITAVSWLDDEWWHQEYKLDQLLLLDEMPCQPDTKSVLTNDQLRDIVFLNREQQELLLNDNKRLYCRSLIADIREDFLFEENDDVLENQAMRYLLQAEDQGLDTDAEQAFYILAALLYGSSFTGSDEVKDFISDYNETPEIKSGFMQQWLRAKQG